ncbi:MAG: AsmA family protein, partial [Terriglobia bacterium]
MSKTSRIILAIAILVAAFIIAVAVVAPRIFQVDHYRPELVSLLEQQTGSRVEIGHLSLRVFPAVSIQVDQLTISNPPGFPRENWLSIPRISAALDSAALWHRQIVIRSLDLE